MDGCAQQFSTRSLKMGGHERVEQDREYFRCLTFSANIQKSFQPYFKDEL